MESRIRTVRSITYRVLASAFLYPDEELTAYIQDGLMVEELRTYARGIEEDSKADFFKTIQDFESTFEGLTLADLQAEHRRVFGHTISNECPAYETEYGGMHIFQQAQELGDIAGFYSAFGLEVSDDIRERPDHISTQLEFMHFLTYKETYARENHGKENAEICREAQKTFLREHLGRWAPIFLERLLGKAERGFYKELAQLTRKFLRFEARFLDIKPEEIRQLQTVSFGPEGECASSDDRE